MGAPSALLPRMAIGLPRELRQPADHGTHLMSYMQGERM